MKKEHLEMEWKVRWEDGQFLIVTDEASPWVICEISEGLPDDDDGAATAMFICQTHNQLFEAKSNAKNEVMK